jgi:hypothetical protein
MDKPANQKLWNMLVIQAKAKFRTWPSLPASKWVHGQYVEKGGRFIASSEGNGRGSMGNRTSKNVHERSTDPKDNKKGSK